MDTKNQGKRMETKLIAWIDDIRKIISRRVPGDGGNIVTKDRGLNVHRTERTYSIGKLDCVLQEESNAREEGVDKSGVDARGKYVLRPRLSWTGLYGKEPWPRERKQWEKV
jgi:hypothetical protein